MTSYNKMKQISVHSIIAFDYIFILIDAHGQVMRVTMFNNIDDICIETGQIQIVCTENHHSLIKRINNYVFILNTTFYFSLMEV